MSNLNGSHSLRAAHRWRVEGHSRSRRDPPLRCAVRRQWSPRSARWPNPRFPGASTGKELHSHSYIDPTSPVDCIDRNVVVVGMNSARDIACELSRAGVARNVIVGARLLLHSKILWRRDARCRRSASERGSFAAVPIDAGLGTSAGAVCARSARWSGDPSGTGCRFPIIPTPWFIRRYRADIAIRLGSGDITPIANLGGDQRRTRSNVPMAANGPPK